MQIETKKVIAREFLILLSMVLICAIVFIISLFYNHSLSTKNKKIRKEISEKEVLADSLAKPFVQKRGFMTNPAFDEKLILKLSDKCVLNYDFAPIDSIPSSEYLTKTQEILITGLYNTVKRLKLYSKSITEFKTKYSNVNSINFLYNGVYKYGLFCKSRREFFNKFYPQFIKQVDYMMTISSVDSLNFNKSIRLQSEVAILKNQEKINLEKNLSSKDLNSLLTKTSIIIFTIFFLARYLYYSIRWSVKILSQKK
jgi:hypothetical protein